MIRQAQTGIKWFERITYMNQSIIIKKCNGGMFNEKCIA